MQKIYTPSNDLLLREGVYRTKIDGLFFLPQARMEDDRGYFTQLELPILEAVLGKPFIIRQINRSHSSLHVIRGLHAEDWNKLISVSGGTIFAALVDIRPKSPTFKQVETILLGESSDALKGMFYISKGIANSFCVINGAVDYVYAVDALYRERDVSKDTALSLFDPSLAIEWPISRAEMIISQRDIEGKNLDELLGVA